MQHRKLSYFNRDFWVKLCLIIRHKELLEMSYLESGCFRVHVQQRIIRNSVTIFIDVYVAGYS